jgi:hypothetical protein
MNVGDSKTFWRILLVAGIVLCANVSFHLYQSHERAIRARLVSNNGPVRGAITLASYNSATGVGKLTVNRIFHVGDTIQAYYFTGGLQYLSGKTGTVMKGSTNTELQVQYPTGLGPSRTGVPQENYYQVVDDPAKGATSEVYLWTTTPAKKAGKP